MLKALALITAYGAARQDLHNRKISNRYLLFCLGMAVMLRIAILLCKVLMSRMMALSGWGRFSCGSLFSRMGHLQIEKIEEMQSADFLRLLMEEIWQILSGMLLPTLLLGCFFYLRKMGAADVKLLIVLGAIMGPEKVLYCMFGGCLAALGMVIGRYVFWQMHGGFLMHDRADRKRPRDGIGYASEEDEPIGIKKNEMMKKSPGKDRIGEIRFAIPVFVSVVLWVLGLY